MSKERPILFSGEMVRAILEGRKTQTRRIVKHAGDDSRIYWNPVVVGGYGGWLNDHGRPRPCPYGKPGDRLWVRETWAEVEGYKDHTGRDPGSIWYRADGQCRFVGSDEPYEPGIAEAELRVDRWRPSIHMPRHASRILLEITDVKVERLNDISAEDAVAEGVEAFAKDHNLTGYWTTAFARLWNSIHGDGAWNVNPFVWAIAFRRINNK